MSNDTAVQYCEVGKVGSSVNRLLLVKEAQELVLVLAFDSRHSRSAACTGVGSFESHCAVRVCIGVFDTKMSHSTSRWAFRPLTEHMLGHSTPHWAFAPSFPLAAYAGNASGSGEPMTWHTNHLIAEDSSRTQSAYAGMHVNGWVGFG